METVRHDLEERDARDAARAIAPMKPAADACVIETTGLALEEVVARIEQDIHDLILRIEGRAGAKTARREPDATARADAEPETARSRSADRSLPARLWYRMVQFSVASLLSATGGLRWSGAEHPRDRGRPARLEPPQPPRRFRPRHPRAAAAQLCGAIDPLPAPARHLDPLCRRFPDPARGDGRVGPEGDAPPPP